MTCPHRSSRVVWCEPDGWEHDEPYQVWEEYATVEDLDLSRYRCTRCGEIFYYTGRWCDYHENGPPCPGSDRVARVPPNVRGNLTKGAANEA